MAFEGDLTNLGLADIFQTLGMNRQSGTLVVKYGDTERRFYFTDEGVSLLTTRSARKFRLGNLLVGMGKLSEGDLKVAVLKQERSKDTKLGDILIQTALVKDEDIKAACRYQAAEEIYDSFNWKSGKFQFLEGANAGPSGGPGPFAEFFYSVTDVVMEAARRADEFNLNLQKIGDPGEFYIRKQPGPLDEEKHGRAAVLLHGMLDGTLDVKTVFEEFFLSPFDTSLAFVALIDAGLIAPTSPAELQERAAPFLEAKDYARASRLLARASFHDPKNGLLLQQLADCHAAAATHFALGRLYTELDQKSEAVLAFQKAIQNDGRLEAAYESLMDAHAALDQFDKAEEACRDAARLLQDDRNFEATLAVIERGLRHVPDSMNLRISRANCLLAMGKRDEGVAEMKEIGAALEERKADRKTLIGVYRKLEQLDPDNAAFRDKVQSLLAGEKASEKRKKVLRLAGFAGAAAALVAVWFLLPKSASARLDEVELFLGEQPSYAAAREDYDRHAATVEAIAADAAPDSDVAARARMITATILDRRSAPERQRKAQELRKAITDKVIKPADALLEAGDYPGAIRKLLEVEGYLKGASSGLAEADLKGVRAGALEDVRGRMLKPADALRAEAKSVQAALGAVAAVDLPKADDEKQKSIYEVARAALKSRDRADWKGTLDGLADAARALGDMEGIRLADLRRIHADMESALLTIEDSYHLTRAALSQKDIRAFYSKTLQEVAEAKADGGVDRGIAACEAFLERCNALRKEEPRKHFAPVVERLFDVLKIDKEVRETHAALVKTRDGLRLAERYTTEGSLQSAFNILRTTIAEAQDVNFQGLARLPLRVESRPPGAKVTVTPAGEPSTEAGTTPLTFRYPYQGRTLIKVELPGFETALIERHGISRDRDAVVNVDLRRNMRWQGMAGAAVEGRPALAPGLVLVGTRGGLFRAFAAEAPGSEVFQLRTGHLSGISGGILVEGDGAYFGGNDGEAFAVDLKTRAFRWKKKTPGPVGTTPAAASGGIVVFADADGHVLAFKADSGDAAWTAELKSPLAGEPLGAGDLVLVGSADGRLTALKAADGTVAWTARLVTPPVPGTEKEKPGAAPGDGDAAAPLSAMGPDGKGGVLVATQASTLVRVLLADGSLAWNVRTEAPLAGRARMHGGRILAVTVKGSLLHVDPATGAMQAGPSLGKSVEGGWTLLGETLYAAGAGGALLAFDLGTGGVLWQFADLGRLRSEPVAAEGILVMAAANSAGAVVVLDP